MNTNTFITDQPIHDSFTRVSVRGGTATVVEARHYTAVFHRADGTTADNDDNYTATYLLQRGGDGRWQVSDYSWTGSDGSTGSATQDAQPCASDYAVATPDESSAATSTSAPTSTPAAQDTPTPVPQVQATTPTEPYAVSCNGSTVPSPETVGQQVTASITINNVGSADMPNLTLDLSSYKDKWTLDEQAARGTKSWTYRDDDSDTVLSFGRVPSGGSVSVNLPLTPKYAGAGLTLEGNVYSNADAQGNVLGDMVDNPNVDCWFNVDVVN
jgi:hypothetical protein